MATSATVQSCPECGASAESDETEVVCPDCGLVVDDSPVDHGPEWRSFNDEPDKSRASPGDVNRDDRGLGSKVGLRSERDRKMNRMNRWHKQSKRGTKRDRNRDYATSEIQRLGSALDLGNSLVEQAKKLFRQLHEKDLLLGRDMDTVTAACVYSTTRIHQRGLTVEEVEAVARVDESKLIARRHTWLCNQLGLQVPPPKPTQRIRVAGNELGADQQDINRAIWLCERVPEDRQARGKPSTLAAACLYQASAFTQHECADAAGVTASALRNRLGDVPELGGL